MAPAHKIIVPAHQLFIPAHEIIIPAHQFFIPAHEIMAPALTFFIPALKIMAPAHRVMTYTAMKMKMIIRYPQSGGVAG